MMKLTDVVNRINGNVDRFTTDLEYYIGGEHFESRELEISNKGLIKPNLNILGFKFHFAFQERDVIFMARNPHLRKAGMVFFSGLCSDASYILRSKDEKILTQEYLAVMLQSDHFWDYCEAHKVGSVNFAINWKTMANYEFDLPSLEKQNEISKKVWAAYRLKKSYKKLIEATDEMVKSQFIEMFGDTPERVELSSLCETFIDGDWIEAKDQAEDGIRLIQTGNVGVGVFKDKGDKARYISEDTFKRLNCTEVKNGDILVSRLPDPVGRACIIPEGLGKTITAVDCTIIRLADKILSKFFIAFTNTPDYAMQIKKVLSGTTRLRVSRANLGKIQVPLPAIQKQIEFVSIAEQADKSKFTRLKSQFIEMFSAMPTTPVKTYVDDSFPGEWGTEDTIGDGVKVIRTTNFTNSGKLNLADVVTRSIEDRKVSRKQIKKYDTILERSGGTADNPVGRVVLFEEDDLFLCNNFTQVLRFKDIDPRFAFYSLYYFYQTNKTAIRSMGSKTTGIQNLNMSKYLEIGIPNASDKEQKEFVAIAEQADKSKYIN